MKQIIALKLLPTEEQAIALRSTMEAFNAACDYLADVAFEERTTNKYTLQKLGYRVARERFGLSSQMAVRAISKTSEAFKVAKERHSQRLAATKSKNIERAKQNKAPLDLPELKACRFKPHGAITYDERMMGFKGVDTVSLLTLTGRVLVPMVFGEYQAARMDRIKGQADLIYRDGQFYLHATIDLPEPLTGTPNEFLGVDLGIVNVATDSDGEVHSGKSLNAVRHRHRRLRWKLQKKRTKSARRCLKRLAGKESRFAKDANHCLSKHIVAKAKRTGRGIAIENLGKIRERVTARRSQRATLHSWSFAQLRLFLTYKAQMAGVALVAVDPRNTSRTCCACGHVAKENRKTQFHFECVSCGFLGLADHVAAICIGSRALVNAPNVSSLTV